MITSTLALLLILITLPVVLVLYITESKQQRAKRLHSRGWTQQRIADRVGVHRTTVGRWLKPA